MKICKVVINTGDKVFLELYDDWDQAKERMAEILKDERPDILELFQSYRIDMEKVHDFHLRQDGWNLEYHNMDHKCKILCQYHDFVLDIFTEEVEIDSAKPLDIC